MAQCYNRFLPDLFAAAQRLRMPSAIRLRAAADMVRRFGAAAFFPLPWRAAATLARGNSATAYPAQCGDCSVNSAALVFEFLKDRVKIHAGILSGCSLSHTPTSSLAHSHTSSNALKLAKSLSYK